jgi:hypothetical protein
MTTSDGKESEMYPPVKKWMVKHFHCFKADVNLGLRYSRVDVLGIRDVGGDLSGEVETIAIEVKRASEPFATGEWSGSWLSGLCESSLSCGC